MPEWRRLGLDVDPPFDSLLPPRRRRHAADRGVNMTKTMSRFLARSRKAVVAGVVAASGVTPSLADVDNEAIRYGATVGAFLVGFAMVWLTPNETAD